MIELDEACGDVFPGEVGEAVLNGGASVGLGSQISVCTIGRREKRTGREKEVMENMNKIVEIDRSANQVHQAAVLNGGAMGVGN
jgi:hypothetical protein